MAIRLTCPGFRDSELSFRNVLNEVAPDTLSSSPTLPFKSGGPPSKACKALWKSFTSRNYRHVDLKSMIHCLAQKLNVEHIDAALNALHGSVVNLHSSKIVEPLNSTQHRQGSPVRDYVLTKMTYNFWLTDVPAHHLKLKEGVPPMCIWNVFHPPSWIVRCSLWKHTREERYKLLLRNAR